jgi:hypothetical protein
MNRREYSDAFQNPNYLGVTVGTVVDTNDPQQCGRLKVLCPSYGDHPSIDVGDLPWAIYSSPFGGTVNNEYIKRGTDQKESSGPVGYGFWNIPKLGSSVLVTCIDGNAMSRVWVGCLHTERLSHTLPHGRFIIGEGGEPDGPLDSFEEPIQPLYDNQTNVFGTRKGNYEWRTRGADYSLSSTSPGFYVQDGINEKADDLDVTLTSADGKSVNIRQGYALSQVEPLLESKTTGKNYDSQVYSWTTPGFHAISMDDRKENCRIRVRTTGGHQIILDDTNERIYISTANGANWLEMDEDGNIDVYSSKKINMHTEGDINFTSNKTIRMFADEAIHMYTKDVRIQTINDFHVRTGKSLKLHSASTMMLQSDQTYHLDVSSSIMITTGKTLNLKASGQILEQGSQIHFNGPVPASAAPANEEPAKWTNRIPTHEPYARGTTASDFSHAPKYSYDDPTVGSEDKTRGPHWRR